VMKGGWHVLKSLLTAQEVTLIGSYIVHWNPESFCLEQADDGKRSFNFDGKLVRVASDFVRNKIKLKSNEMTLKDLQVQLSQTYLTSTTDQLLGTLFEQYVVKYFSPGEAMLGFPPEFKDFKRLDRNFCKFANMEPHVWYYPFDTSFPVGELYGKLPNGKLLLISVSKINENKVAESTACLKLVQKLEMTLEEAKEIQVVYCRKVSFSKWKIR
jgi:hypothetical protein